MPLRFFVPHPRGSSVSALVHPGDALSRAERLTYILVLGALTALGPFTIDLYLPALPVLEHELAVPTAAVQLTLTATMIGFAVGQLLVGPLSDQVGRRRPLLIATGLHITACLGAALAPDLFWLGLARVFQGFGAAAGAVVAMAMVRDLFGGYPLVRMLSRLALVSGLAPVLAPVIGSQLLLAVDWRGLFVFLSIYGFIVLVATALFLRETLEPAARSVRGHSSVGQRYGALFRDRVYVGAVLIAGMNFSALFAYLSSSSFLFQDVYALTPQQYGFLFGINSIGVVVGVQVSSRLQKRIGPQWIIAGATILQLVSAIAIVVLDSSGRRFPRHRDPAVVLHRRMRVQLPGDLGARAGEARPRSGHRRVRARRDELRRGGSRVAARRTLHDHERGPDGLGDGHRGGHRDRGAVDGRAPLDRAAARGLSPV